MSNRSSPNVFIIESTELDDEGRYSEGKALCEILRMMEKEPIYKYIRTAKELETMAREFGRSRYRYLHLSCHGNEREFWLALESVSFAGFATIFKPYLKNRRVFLSACSTAQSGLARELFKGGASSPYSVTGPSEDIYFADAAVTWVSLYNLLFRDGSEAIKGNRLRNYLNQLCLLNGLRYVHFGRRATKPYYARFEFPRD